MAHYIIAENGLPSKVQRCPRPFKLKRYKGLLYICIWCGMRRRDEVPLFRHVRGSVFMAYVEIDEW